MKKTILFLMFGLILQNASAQKYFTKEGKVSFLSSTPLEKIEGFNSKASSVIDVATSAIEFAVLVKAFRFDKALMQEHFNENYLESEKYPKSTFKGRITNISAINFQKDGEYTATITGNLEMHGVSKPVSTKAKFIVKGGKITGTAKFTVLLADYNIVIPSVVKDKVSKEVDINIEANYELLK